jgi:hypothetical protein
MRQHRRLGMCMYVYVCLYVWSLFHDYVEIMYLYIFACMYAYTYIHTYIHTGQISPLQVLREDTMHIHTYIHTHTHTYIHIYIHTHTHKYIYTYTHTYIHTGQISPLQVLGEDIMHIHTYIHTHTYTYRSDLTPASAWRGCNAHTYIHAYIHTYIHTGQNSLLRVLGEDIMPLIWGAFFGLPTTYTIDSISESEKQRKT